MDEMTSDAMVYLLAGMETTGHCLVVITWALLNNPPMLHKLEAELKSAMPGRDDIVDSAKLENLPYLVCKHWDGGRQTDSRFLSE